MFWHLSDVECSESLRLNRLLLFHTGTNIPRFPPLCAVQFGGGTASLNVTVSAGIVLHRFATWAGYAERQRDGEKFVVDPRPDGNVAQGESARIGTDIEY